MKTAITTLTLFTEDLKGSKEFYQTAFGLPVHWEDDDSAVFDFGNTLINLLKIENAPEVTAPAKIGAADAGTRALITITVDDVDADAAALAAKGIAVISGPIDRPWGVRTAAFADPNGNVWELAQPLKR